MSAYTCAICRIRVEYDGPVPTQYPFCSQRCQFLDLAKWLSEDYTVDRELSPDELVDLGESSPEE